MPTRSPGRNRSVPFTAEALAAIAVTTIANITGFEGTGCALHEVSVEKLA
jgi:hypothetical protein